MDTELRALLTANGVDNRIIMWMEQAEQSCTTMKAFANWVDSRQELHDQLLKHTDLRDSRSELSCLKQAWREAEAKVPRFEESG